PLAFRRRRVGGGEGVGVEEHQRDEEAAEAEQDRRRVGGDVAHPIAGQEQREARPQRQQPGPQQQRAFLRRPHRRGPVGGGRRAAGGVGHGGEREVVAQEGDLQDDERDRQDSRQGVHRAP